MERKYTRGKETLTIIEEDNVESPRETHDHFGKMICFHGRYKLGDKHNLDIEAAKALEDDKSVIALPLYLYDHSGQTMSTKPFTCQWDSGKVGFIYVDKSVVLKDFSAKRLTTKLRKRAEGILEHEVEEFNAWLQGECYYFTVENAAGEVTDSCGGFIGSDPDTNGIFDHVGKGWVEVEENSRTGT